MKNKRIAIKSISLLLAIIMIISLLPPLYSSAAAYPKGWKDWKWKTGTIETQLGSFGTYSVKYCKKYIRIEKGFAEDMGFSKSVNTQRGSVYDWFTIDQTADWITMVVTKDRRFNLKSYNGKSALLTFYKSKGSSCYETIAPRGAAYLYTGSSGVNTSKLGASVINATSNKQAVKQSVKNKKSAKVTTTITTKAKTYSSGAYITIPKSTPLNITAISSDGESGKTVYSNKSCWVSLNYVSYIAPTITKPDPPTVNITSAKDIPLGGLIDVSWNSPADAKYYTVIFKNASGAEVNRYENVYGNSASFQAPNPGTYTVEVIAKNSMYSSEPGKSGTSVTVHDLSTVTFLNDDGTVLAKQKVAFGDNAVAPVAPDKVGHTFQSWSDSLSNIKADKSVRAVYAKTKYTVRFIGFNNEVLDKQIIEYGNDATPPENVIAPTNYTFRGWSSEEYKNVYSIEKNEPIDIYAIFAWENEDLPIICNITSAVRQQNGYKITYDIENYPDSITRGRVIAALKTSEDKLVYLTESSAFSLDKSEKDSGLKIFIPCEKAATKVELFVINGYTDNIMSEGIPISKKVVSPITEGRMWSDWQEGIIEENNDNEIESRIEYRYRNRRDATNNTKTKEGYLPLLGTNGQIKSTSAFAAGWSAWQDSKIEKFTYEDRSRDVKTQVVPIYAYRTKYNYYHYHSFSNGLNNSYQYNSTYQYHAISIDYGLSYKSTGSTGINWYGTYGCPSCGHSNYWIPNGTSSEQYQSGSKTQYSYRDTLYTYYFYRWDDKDWSAWQPEAVLQSDTRQVETRVVFREKSVSAGIEDTSGETRTFNGNAGAANAGKNITFYVSKYNALSDFTDEYVAQTIIADDGSYSFTYKLREEPTEETGDYTIFVGIEGTTEKQVVGKIEAPKPVYTVQFTDANGNVINTQQVTKGESAKVPSETPEKEGYTFVCWNNGLTNIQSNYTAEDNNAITPVFTENIYKVVYIDWRNQTYETMDCTYGTPVAAPDTSPCESGTFIGWQVENGEYAGKILKSLPEENADDSVIENVLVKSDLIITAVYETNTYEVTFYDKDGAVINEQTVEYDGVAQTPEISEDDNIEYIDWDIDLENLYGVKEDIAVVPTYTFKETTSDPVASVPTGVYDIAQSIELTCEDENAVIYYTIDGSDPTENPDAHIYSEPINVSSGTEINYYATSFNKNASSVVTDYYVIGNDKALITMHSNIDENTSMYFVDSLSDFNSNLLEIDGYSLDGIYIDDQFTNLFELNESNTGAFDLYAKYNVNTYTVTFLDDRGFTIDVQQIEYLDSATPPELSDKGSLIFLGWDSDDYLNVSEDITINAVYKDKSEVTEISFDKSSYQMQAGSNYLINANITAPDTFEDVNDAVVWSSDDASVATVDNLGLVTALGEGNTIIRASSIDGYRSAEMEIHVVPDMNSKLMLRSSSILSIDSEGYIRRIPIDGTNTVAFIASQFANSNKSIVIEDMDGNLLSTDKLVSTGSVIALVNNGNVIDSKIAVMTGDIKCDGEINNKDVSYLARVILKKQTAEPYQFLAMDVNGDGKVNNRDAAMLSRYLVGKETIA